MTPNPYAPPGAEVADPVHGRPSPPPSVRNACLLILASLALGLVTLLPDVRLPAPDESAIPLGVVLGIVVVFGGLTVWFAIQTLRGRNWARWAMLFYLMLGWLLVGSELDSEMARAPMAAIIDTVCIAMELVACGLLFFGTGGRWFSERAAVRSRTSAP
jgi:hypothetical protein